MPEAPWWQTAVVYQIYPRSFLDANGDGVGDLEGIRRRLDHIADLGADAVWISPFYRSPMADFGYDVSDYCDVDPLFGDLADFDRLVAEAHARGLKVLIDWVPNHTSDQHPWFRDHPDWYIWHDGPEPPNNWLCAFTRQSAWTYVPERGQSYLHLFLPEQPDLDWANPAVRAAMHDTLRFWIDRGVDGFRIDVIHGLGKDPALPDDPADAVANGIPHSTLNDVPVTHDYIRELRRLLDETGTMMVGEVYLLDTNKVAAYYGTHEAPELHLAFNFPPLYTAWDAAKWRRQIERAEQRLPWPTWVLSNHDNARHRTRYGGGAAPAKAAAVLLLTLRGTPFLYAGEELGLLDAVIPPERVVDPGGRDGCRGMIPWPGLPQAEGTWLPYAPEPDDAAGFLDLYRALLALRRRTPDLTTGDLTLLDGPDGVLAYRRGEHHTVAVNFTGEPVAFEAPGTPVVTAGDYSDGVLGASAAVVFTGE